MAAKMQPVNLVKLKTEDGWTLNGAYFSAETAGSSRTGALLLHGKTGNFYSGPGSFIAPALSAAGYDALTLNMRTHDLGYGLSDREAPLGSFDHPMWGGAWEILDQGHHDLRAGLGFLRDAGCSRTVLIGHSSGGFYLADYAARDPDVAAFLFISPLLTNRTALRRWFDDDAAEREAYDKAKQMIADGHGRNLIPLRTWYLAISAESLVDRIDERPGWFDDSIAETRAPILMLCGGLETRVEDWRQALERMPSPDKQFVVVPGAEHAYIGHEDEAISAVVDFLDAHLP